MRSAVFAAAFAALAIAAPAPVPQLALPIDDIEADFEAAMATTSALGPEITAIADPVDYVPSAAAASAVSDDVTAANSGLVALATETPTTVAAAEKRAATSTCPGATQPTGFGPVISPDTASAFLSDAGLAASASAAAAPTGYTSSFVNLQGSSQQIGYLGLYTLKAYDPSLCSAKCDKVSTCMAFNIYFERDPTVNPDSTVCTNPPSLTNIKCTLYGYPVSGDFATNAGQYRSQFQVVIAGSNGYTKTLAPSAITNFTNVGSYGAASINAPLDTNYQYDSGNTFIVSKTATDPYNPAICAAYCQTQTAYDKANPDKRSGSPVYKACNFFNQYILMKDGDAQGTVCALYTEQWDASYATNTGYWSTDSAKKVHHWTISNSWGYAINSPDSGNVVYTSKVTAA
ncbi:hypothetical protein MBLNU459_g0108t1 [Dothideomycetes sp. NU459]